MATLIESGMAFEVPEHDGFRFQDFPSYKRLSGMNLKEMDVGWWDHSQGVLILVELKGVEHGGESGEDCRTRRLDGLERKANDTLLILGSAWSKTKAGLEIAGQLPPKARVFPGEKKLRLVFVIDTPESRRELLTAVKDELNSRLAGRLRLFDIPRVAVVDVDTAASRGIPVSHAS